MAKVTVSPDSEESILTAAEAVFRQAGFARGTIRDIATECGMSVGAVASLGSKEELLVRVVERRIAALQRADAADVDPDQQGATTQTVLAQLGRFYDFFAQEWPLAREYLSVLISGRHRSSALDAMVKDLVDTVAARLSADLAMPHPDAHEVAESIYLVYAGSLLRWGTMGLQARDECFDALSRAVAALITRRAGAVAQRA